MGARVAQFKKPSNVAWAKYSFYVTGATIIQIRVRVRFGRNNPVQLGVW